MFIMSAQQTNTSNNSADVNSDSNLIAALAYLPVLQPFIPIVTLLLRPNDKFVKFHSIQALGLFLAIFIGGLIFSIIAIIFAVATLGLGIFLLLPIFAVCGLAELILSIILMIKAYQAEKYKLPVIGEWAETFK